MQRVNITGPAQRDIDAAYDWWSKNRSAEQAVRWYVGIHDIVERRRLTQTAAGKLLGINQPKVSTLLNGRLDGFSTDRLIRFLNKLGCDVRITVSRPHARKVGKVQVQAG